MSRAARVANIDRTTLYRLIAKYSLGRDRATVTTGAPVGFDPASTSAVS